MQHEVFVRGVAGDEFAFNPACPFRVKTRDIGSVASFVLRIGYALAGLLRERRANLRRAFNDRIGETAKMFSAFNSRQRTPLLLCTRRGFDRAQRVVLRGKRDTRDDGRRGGIIDFGERIGLRLDKTAIDEITVGAHRDCQRR